jgi:hypothetical protein
VHTCIRHCGRSKRCPKAEQVYQPHSVGNV